MYEIYINNKIYFVCTKFTINAPCTFCKLQQDWAVVFTSSFDQLVDYYVMHILVLYWVNFINFKHDLQLLCTIFPFNIYPGIWIYIFNSSETGLYNFMKIVEKQGLKPFLFLVKMRFFRVLIKNLKLRPDSSLKTDISTIMVYIFYSSKTGLASP